MRIGIHLAVAVLAVLTVPGCERLRQKFEPPASFVPPERPNDSCNSAPFRPYLGQPFSALQGIFIPEPYRVLEEDSQATADYSPARLNFLLSADGTLRDLSCG